MAQITIADIRSKYPQYNDLSDQQLADAMHEKHYSDMPKQDFYDRIGFADLTSETAPADARAPDQTGGFSDQLLAAMGPATAPVFNSSPQSSLRPRARPVAPGTEAPVQDGAVPSAAALDPLIAAMAGHDAAPKVDLRRPPSPPIRPREGDNLLFGMMGGASPEMDAWARREIQRQEAERGTPLSTAQNPQKTRSTVVDTGRKTQYGRTLWQAQDGSVYSEKTVTAQAKDGKWYNVPTVTGDGRILDPDLMTRAVGSDQWKPVDGVTGAPLEPFATPQAAEQAARARSDGMDTGEDPFAGEGAGALLKRRGQQFMQGASEMLGSSVEGVGALSQRAMRKPEVDKPGTVLSRTAKATGQALRNVPENLLTGWYGMKLAKSELGQEVSPTDIAAQMQGATELADIEDQMTSMKAQMDKSPREAAALQEQYLALSQRRGQLRELYGAAAETIASETAQLSRFESAGAAARQKIGQLDKSRIKVDAEPGSPEYYVSAAIASSAEMAPALAASAIMRNPLPAMVFMGGYSGGTSYVEGRDKGLSPHDARGYATLYAAAEGIPEALPVHILLKPGTKFFTRIFSGAAAEGAQEMITEALQVGIDKGYVSPDMSWAEARQRIADAGIIGTLAGGVMGGGVATVDAAINQRNRDRRQKDDSENAAPQPAPSQPATPTADPLLLTMGQRVDQPAPPRETPAGPVAPAAEANLTPDVQSASNAKKPAPPAAAQTEAKPAPERATPSKDASNQVEKIIMPDESGFEILDEVETVDGDTRPTGRKVRVNLTTGEASVVDATEAAGPPPASAPAERGTQPDSQPQEPEDARQVGAETGAAAGGARPGPQRKFLSHDETVAIETDPTTFQYKGGADTEGVTSALQGITRFDPNRAGQVVLFETKDGRTIVADGHQRTGLARRTAAAGQKDVGGMAAVVYREADGYTPEEVMALAALKNIGEGSGTAVDAARILRTRPESIEDMGLPPQSALVRTAEGLRRLSDQAFGMVVNGKASEQNGAIVGRTVARKDAQLGILGLLTKLNPANAFQAESIARQAAQDVTTETQSSLFGDEEIAANLYLERAKVLDSAVKRLNDDRRLFGTLTDRIEAITSAGNVLAADENAKRLDAAGRMRDYLTSQANVKGPISEALSASARDIKAGRPVGEATGRFLEALKRELEGDGGRSAETPGRGSVDQGKGEGQRQEIAPPQDDLLTAMGVKPAAESKPAPKPSGPAGNDLLAMMGAKPQKNPELAARAEAEAKVKAAQSKKGTTTPQGDAGPLFDTQGDIEKSEQLSPGQRAIRRGRDILEPYSNRNDAPFDKTAGVDLRDTANGIGIADRIASAKTLDAKVSAAEVWVASMGKKTGIEHIVALDPDGIPLAIMSGHKSGVSMHTAVWRAGADGKVAVSVHNHPSSGGFSPGDVAVLSIWPKHRMIVVAENGDRHEIVATERFQKKADADSPYLTSGAARDEIQVAWDALRLAIHSEAWEIARLQGQPDGGLGAFTKAMRPIFGLALERAGMVRYKDSASWLKAFEAEGFNFEDIYGQVSGTLADRLGRAGFTGAETGHRGGDQEAGSSANTAPPGTDVTNKKPARDGEESDRGGRVPEEDRIEPDDFDSALDAVFGKPETAPPEPAFDVGSFDKSRKDRIAASKADGNTHLDQVDPSVETLRGKAIYYVHDQKVRGVIRTVSNSKEVVVHWSDAYSAEKELAVEKTYGKKRVMESWLALSDLKDYVLGTPDAETKAKPTLSPWRVERYEKANGPSEEWRVARNNGDNRHDVWGYYATRGEAESARAYAAKRAPASEKAPQRPASDIAKDLGDLFSEPDTGFREGEIDEGKYAQAVPLFTEALRGVDVRAMSQKDIFVAMIRPLAAAGLKREAVAKMRPYFDRYLDDLDSGRIDLSQEAQNAPGTSGDLERDRGDADPSDGLGKADVPAPSRGDGTGAGTRGATPDGRGEFGPGGERVSPDDAAPMGTGRDQGIQGEGRPGQQPADDRDGAAGRGDGEPRISPDDGPASVTGDLARNSPAVKDRVAAQRAADERARRGIRLADDENVRATLPLLKPEQQDDVVKIERRFLKPDGHGMLLTNGTGTGKTYSGGGVVKRFAQAGKNNILILAPSQGILDHWIDALGDLGLKASKLTSTTEAGKGIVVTTYANAGVNNALAGRDWDLVVSDEAHKLSQNAAGDSTSALDTLRAISNRPQDLWRKSHMIHDAEWAKLKGMKDGEAKTAFAHRLYAQQNSDIEAFGKQPRAKVLFLSATPFAYDKNIDYGDGYLFNYPDDGHVGHSRQSGQNLFMVQNFGYRIRYHKLTRPDANVDSGVFEREFHEKLRREGVLSGRHLDIEPDYERRFVQREDAQGSQIDGILDFIREQAYGKGRDKDVYSALLRSINKNFNYLRRMQLLEAIKAKAAQPDIDKHLALGRKVVIFHDYNVGGGFNPFRPGAGPDGPADQAAYEGYAALIAAKPEAENLNFTGYRPPVGELKAVYGDRAVIYNGTIPAKERAKAKADFNKDGSGVDVMIVQSAAGEAGISLHDVTGGHQRVLINLGMPTRPTTALQEEGRIRREGSVSDAMFHYYTIGTTWERQAFARKIAERSGTVENLALGNEARTIRDSFIEAYEGASPWEPSDADGKGGKERDRAVAKATPYEIAKTHYFGRMKTKGRRDQREGIDFYATPEPLGFKMVEWAGIRPYERVLEPSAGDAAIARYFPEHSDRTIIEPSADLLSRAQLRAVGAKGVRGTFEDYHVVNKHHVIVMNPPFGSGGKTAIEHLGKAAKHLRPGGRIVALIPTGPSADKRFDAWWDSDDSMGLVRAAEVALPAVTFEKAGTAVASRIVIIDKIPSPSDRDTQREMTGGTKHINMTGASTIGEFFDRLEGISVPDRPAPAREAGDEILDEQEAANPAIVAPERPAAPLHGPEQDFTTAETIHGKTGEKLWVATATKRVDDAAWKATVAVAKRHGGWFSSFRGRGAIPGYQFKSEADRQAFLDDMKKPTVGFEETDPGFARDPYDPQPADAIRDMMPMLRAELDRLDLKRVRLFHDETNMLDLPEGTQGMFLRNPHGGMAIVVAASLDPMKTVHHEVIHALRSMNLFTPEEWRALEIKAARTWVAKFDIVARYPNLLPSEQIEEAIAEAFADAAATKTAPTGSLLVRAFNKIARFLKALGNVFRGTGFTTPEDVFGRVLAGQLTKRNAGNAGALMAFQDDGKRHVSRAARTDTPEFRAWFGDSKVVDENGKPLVVYHGSPDARFLSGDDAQFKGRAARFGMAPRDDDGAFWFASSRSTAESYADDRRAFDYQNAEPGVSAFYVSLKNPLIIDGGGRGWRETQGRGKTRDLISQARAEGRDGVIIRNVRDNYNNTVRTAATDTYVAFRPEQIKSVNNRGTFDPKDARISYQSARVPSRQARAHMATAMGGQAVYIPDRRIWEELTAAGRPIWARLREGLGAATDAIDKARIRLQDRFLPVLRAQEAVMRATGAALPTDHNAYIAETTFSGKVGRHLFEIDEDFTKPIVERIAKTKGGLTADYVGEWLTARHAIERNAHIASINPKMPDGGSGMTDADAQAILAAAAAGPHAQTLQEIGDLIDKLRERTLTLREDAGLITHAEANLWRKQYQFYVPLKGFAETDHSEAVLDLTGVGRRFNVRGGESQRALGRRSEAFNPLQAAITQAQEVAIRAEKNRVGQALYNLAKDFPSPALWSVKKVATKRYYNRTTGLVETRAEDPVSLFMDPNEMAVKVGGEEQRVIFHDPRLARAAGSVGADQMGWFLSMMSVAARYFSSINTMLDPEFVIRNAFRDMTAAQVNIRNFGEADRNAIAVAMLKNWPKAFVGAFRGQGNKADSTWTRHYREFEQSGAKVSFWKLEQPEAGKADLDKRIRLAGGSRLGPASRFVRFSTRDNPVLGFIERTNLAVDNAVRLAAYVAARDRGWSKADAAVLAKNLTVNFNRRGEWGSTINALYPFANASIQGTQILFRAMSSKRMAKYGIGLVALGIILDMVNAGLSEEDDDGELAYDKIADWKNRTNLMVMLGPESGEAATIWLPYGYSLFPYLGQQIGKVGRGVKKPGAAMADFAAAMFGAFSPIQGEDFQTTLTPTMFDPINEMAMNKDWLGHPIRPENAYADYGPDAYKFYAGASEVSKQLADLMNRATGGSEAESGAIDVSPEYIDHIFGFMTGGAGRTVGRSADIVAKSVTGNFEEIELRDIPVARSLVYDTGDWLDRDRYYRFRDAVKEAHASAKIYQEAGKAVPKHVAKVNALYNDVLAAEKALKAIKKQGGGDQAKIFVGFNRRYLKVAGPQGE